MYKLFLTFRYLTRKAIVIFPVLVVWLCVMMMIIVTSIMGGFVERVRQANREIQGDIVVYNESGAGWGHYEDVLDLLNKMPEVQAATPVVSTYGLFNLLDYPFQKPLRVLGIDPVGRAKIGTFRQTLFREYQAPLHAIEDLSAGGLPASGKELKLRADQAAAKTSDNYRTCWRDLGKARSTPGTPFMANKTIWLIAYVAVVVIGALALLVILSYKTRYRHGFIRLAVVLGPLVALVALLVPAVKLATYHPLTTGSLAYYTDRFEQANVAAERAYRTLAMAQKLNDTKSYTAEDLKKTLLPAEPSFTPPAAATQRYADPSIAAKEGCIVGVDVGLYARDRRGNYDRALDREYPRAVLTVVPVGVHGSLLVSQKAEESLVVVDDSYSKVYDVDSQCVYIPFDLAQKMAGMRSNLPKDDPDYSPPRCSEILIKLKNSDDPNHLEAVRTQIADQITALRKRLLSTQFDLPSLKVQTWDQRQATYLNAVENEKYMQIFILGLMSCVVLVVIFLIFYMIVRDKTRDIGIIKAIGGTEWGVLQIFVFYGMFIGVVGGLLGVLCGVEFVTHTNEIHEWIYQLTGRMIWDRSVYLFDRIPDVVNYREVLGYFAAAVIAGGLGALIPAIVAGYLKSPTEAVRYE